MLSYLDQYFNFVAFGVLKKVGTAKLKPSMWPVSVGDGVFSSCIKLHL